MSTLKEEIDLLLIGKTGNGKSKTGNSILLRENSFLSSGSANSVTFRIRDEVSEYKGRIIKVVDSPGIGETRYENEESVKLVTKALKQAIMVNPNGYHAFVIVIKYGNRFTAEEKNTIKFLKGFFGDNFVRDYCIIIMSNGDSFESDNYNNEDTFESWCERQDGEIKELLKECENRIVLFNNNLKPKKQHKKEEQLDKLLYLVDHLSAGGKRYVNANFEEAKQTRARIMVEAKHAVINEETKKETSLILQKLTDIQNIKDENLRKTELLKLKERSCTLLDETKLKDKGTNALIEIIQSIETTHATIESELLLIEKLNIQREEQRKLEEEIKNRLEEERQKVQLEIQRLTLEEKLKYEQQMREKEKREEEERKKREVENARKEKQAEEERQKLIRDRKSAEELYRSATDKSNQSLVSRGIDFMVSPIKGAADWLSSWF